MYTSGGEVILGHFLCLDVENMGLDDISWRRLHFLETWLKYGSEADYYLKGPRGARANGLSTSDGHAQLGLSRPSLGPSARAEDRSDAWAPRGEVGALGEYYRCPADADGC